jgi:hypothetical protein
MITTTSGPIKLNAHPKKEGLPDVSYPVHDKTVTVTNCGRVCLDGWKIQLNTLFAGHKEALL